MYNNISYYILHWFWMVLVVVSTINTMFFFVISFFWCPCMTINVTVKYNGRLLPDIILLTQCYYHRGTRLNAMKRFCFRSL